MTRTVDDFKAAVGPGRLDDVWGFVGLSLRLLWQSWDEYNPLGQKPRYEELHEDLRELAEVVRLLLVFDRPGTWADNKDRWRYDPPAPAPTPAARRRTRR